MFANNLHCQQKPNPPPPSDSPLPPADIPPPVTCDRLSPTPAGEESDSEGHDSKPPVSFPAASHSDKEEVAWPAPAIQTEIESTASVQSSLLQEGDLQSSFSPPGMSPAPAPFQEKEEKQEELEQEELEQEELGWISFPSEPGGGTDTDWGGGGTDTDWGKDGVVKTDWGEVEETEVGDVSRDLQFDSESDDEFGEWGESCSSAGGGVTGETVGQKDLAVWLGGLQGRAGATVKTVFSVPELSSPAEDDTGPGLEVSVLEDPVFVLLQVGTAGYRGDTSECSCQVTFVCNSFLIGLCQDPASTPALEFRWPHSVGRDTVLETLGIDARGVVSRL